jgi:hypothetical protein
MRPQNTYVDIITLRPLLLAVFPEANPLLKRDSHKKMQMAFTQHLAFLKSRHIHKLVGDIPLRELMAIEARQNSYGPPS